MVLPIVGCLPNSISIIKTTPQKHAYKTIKLKQSFIETLLLGDARFRQVDKANQHITPSHIHEHMHISLPTSNLNKALALYLPCSKLSSQLLRAHPTSQFYLPLHLNIP